MNDKRKKFLAEQVIKASNSEERLAITMAVSKRIVRTKFNTLSGEEFEKIWSEFGPHWYLDELAKLYCQLFTLDELKQVLAFWLSKAGQKLVRGEYAAAEIRLGLTWSLELESECQRVISKRGNYEVNHG